MPFIGNQPALSYTSFAVQHFTTSATTSYTLDYSVANETEIRLVINNVVQQPGSSYAYTASGTSLVLSSATSATDTMYAVFLGKAVQTVNPPNASVGTSQLADNGVTTAKIANDAVTKDKVSNLMYPAFEAYLSADQTITESVDTKVQFDTEVFDTDNCYDNTTNYRFTPNVAGKYFVYLFIRGDATNSNTLDFLFSRLYKNGSNYRESLIDVRNNYGRQATVAVNAILDMNGTTDYLEGFLRVDTQATTPKAESGTKSCFFGAYRIGD